MKNETLPFLVRNCLNMSIISRHRVASRAVAASLRFNAWKKGDFEKRVSPIAFSAVQVNGNLSDKKASRAYNELYAVKGIDAANIIR